MWPFLDDDDMFVPSKIALQVDGLRSKPKEYGACTCIALHIIVDVIKLFGKAIEW